MENKVELKDDDILYSIKKPKDSCNHCYGRGYEGFNLITQEPTLCRCLTRQGKGDFITVGQFHKIQNTRKPIVFTIEDKEGERT